MTWMLLSAVAAVFWLLGWACGGMNGIENFGK